MFESPVNWFNPYARREGAWLRGTLHVHTHPASACGTLPPERMLHLYAQKGYDFVALADHMRLTEAAHDTLLLLPGMEWNNPRGGDHTGIYSLDRDLLREVPAFTDHNALLAHLAGRDALVVLNHPNWQLTSHYRRETLLSRAFYGGLEIRNGVIDRLQGEGLATDKWDYLLANGRRVPGFGADDSHGERDVGLAWTCVRCAERTPASVLRALRAGNAYASTGVEILDIRRTETEIVVESANAQEIRALVDGGVCFARTEKNALHLSTRTGGFRYVRFDLYGPGSAMAWTQPFFLKG